MNITFIAQRYYPFMGGVETQTRLVAKALHARGHSVRVGGVNFVQRDIPQRLAMLEDSLLVPPYDDYNDDGVPVHALTPTPAERLQMAPIAVRAIPRLQRHYYHALRRFGYRWYRSVYREKLRPLIADADVVHSVAGGYLGWAAQEVAQEEGVPFVLTPYVHPGQHGDSVDDVAFYTRSDAVLALLETDKGFLTDLGVPDDLIHLYGVVPLLAEGADSDRFRTKYGLGDAPVVLFVGRLNAYKGLPTIVEAAPEVWEAHPEARFIFCGPATAEEQRVVESADDRIQYLGLVSEEDKADAYAACTLFCMPSTHEILPAVYLEAWSMGKPVIGGPAPGLEALIEGHDGGVVVEQEPAAVADAITHMLEAPDERERLGANGHRLVKERFSEEALVRVLERVYAAVS